MRRLLVLAAIGVLAACSVSPASVPNRFLPARAIATPTPAPVFWVTAPIAGDPSPLQAHVPRTGAVVEGATVRLPHPASRPVPRRVGIQVGHWKLGDVPSEFPHLAEQTGGEFEGVHEVDVNLDVGQRVAK